MAIRVLDAATVGRIAAGEVVERPSSVVKELVENSLDAGASSITVEYRGGGIDYLRVTDNGCGIEPGQVRLAFENHATSKLQSADQLDDIRTLGFRGEALPSIAAVARVELTTRARGQQSGTRFTCEGGRSAAPREAGCPEGTTLVIRDLFFNLPVRRAFLKKPGYEGGLVTETVTRLMLGNPKVSIRLISGGNTVYHTFGDGKLRHAVFAVYGRATAEGMVEVDACEGGTRIHGLIGVGELAKPTRAHQMFFINGRSVRCPLLSRALEQVCKSRVTIGMYPMCALHLELPPAAVDVNVHPNKLEVRFRDEDGMRLSCEKLLETAFAGERVLDLARETSARPTLERTAEVRELPLAAAAPAAPPQPAPDAAKMPPLPEVKPVQVGMRFDAPGNLLREDRLAALDGRPIKTVDKMPESASAAKAASGAGESPAEAAAQAASAASSARPPVAEAASNARTPATGAANAVSDRPTPAKDPVPAAQMPALEAQTAAPAGPGAAVTEAAPPVAFRVIGVAFKTYILVEAGESLLLIDQHAAHERLRYEMLMARARAGTASQQLLTPVTLRLSDREMAVVEDNLDCLSDAGYTVEPFGAHDIQLRAVPFVLGRAELRPLFLDMLKSLNELKTATVETRRGEIMQMACKGAVKAGDALSNSEIRTLIVEMLETGAPPTCPHGRPVVKTLSRRELEKMFKRIQ